MLRCREKSRRASRAVLGLGAEERAALVCKLGVLGGGTGILAGKGALVSINIELLK